MCVCVRVCVHTGPTPAEPINKDQSETVHERSRSPRRPIRGVASTTSTRCPHTQQIRWRNDRRRRGLTRRRLSGRCAFDVARTGAFCSSYTAEAACSYSEGSRELNFYCGGLSGPPALCQSVSSHLPPHSPTPTPPSVTSSQPSLKAAVDKGGDIKVTPEEGEHLSSASFLSSPSLFFYFISAALSPLCPLSVFGRPVSVHQEGDHHSGTIDFLRCACRTRNRRLGGLSLMRQRRREGRRRVSAARVTV